MDGGVGIRAGLPWDKVTATNLLSRERGEGHLFPVEDLLPKPEILNWGVLFIPGSWKSQVLEGTGKPCTAGGWGRDLASQRPHSTQG